MKNIHRFFLQAPTTLTLLVLTIVSLIMNLWVTDVLNANYAASKFPVPFFIGQLSFSPEKIKDWYAFMVEHGTLGQYILTQHIDSLFILSTLVLHGVALVLISRLFAAGSKARSVMVACAMLSAIAPIADQVENLVSYVMLADPAGFPDFLAYIYSSLAALKFAMFMFAYLAAPLGLIVGAFMRIKSRNVIQHG
ncbi:MAG: hypothetical protein V4805_07685 [Pseudomonadota bacterium]